jgi:hypothetical protein
MKKILTIMMFCGFMSAFAQAPPPHAASTETWEIELPNGVTQIWSDYINLPECNKEEYDDSNKADCHRSEEIFYAYNAGYVEKYVDKLCPAPWRLPTSKDVEHTNTNIYAAWLVDMMFINIVDFDLDDLDYLPHAEACWHLGSKAKNHLGKINLDSRHTSWDNLYAMNNKAVRLFSAVRCIREEVGDQSTPPFAASAETWAFGNQTWSDAIHMPTCNKETFEGSYTDPDCRSYTSGANTWYYYNWPYVNQHAAMLCPSPWRTPTRGDFKTLASNTNNTALIGIWGYGGRAYDSSIMNDVSTRAYYWSSTELSSNTNLAYRLYFGTSGYVYPQDTNYKDYGYQVRCVK